MVDHIIYWPSMSSLDPHNCPKWPLCHKTDKTKKSQLQIIYIASTTTNVGPNTISKAYRFLEDIECLCLKPFLCGVTVSTSFGSGTRSVGDGPESPSSDLNEAFSHPSSHYMRQKSCETFHRRSPTYIRLEAMMIYIRYHRLIGPICFQIEQNYPCYGIEASFGMSGLL